MLLILSKFFILLMFFLSGLQKIYLQGNIQTKQLIVFSNYFNIALTQQQSKHLVLIAGLIEVLAVLSIVYGEIYKKYLYINYGILTLILFTIIVSIVFKLYPKFKKIQLLSNLSVLGGLLLYYSIINNYLKI